MNDEASTPPKRNFLRLSSFFWISLGVHGLLVLGAATLVVQNITAKRKVSFKGAGEGPPKTSERALEYKVTSPTTSASSPALARRIAAQGASAIALPEMPAMPDVSAVSPISMPGLSAAGLGFALGTGTGFGTGLGGGGGGGGGGGRMTMFGSTARQAGALTGYFYDLKQTSDGKPSGMDGGKYSQEVQTFVNGPWDENVFAKYFKATKPMYANRLFMPVIPADEGPKAFGVEKKVQATMWVVVYRGAVAPPFSGRFRFVGKGDDLLIVRFNGKIVLDQHQGDAGVLSNWPTTGKYYNYQPMGFWAQFLAGDWIDVTAQQSYPIEIITGERPGGQFACFLMTEEEGKTYAGSPNAPALPIFQIEKMSHPKLKPDQVAPVFDENGAPWSGGKI